MLRNCQQQYAFRFQCSMYLGQHFFVFFNVFQHIKSSDSIKLINKRNMPRIHLHEIDSGLSGGSKGQTCGKQFTAVELRLGMSLCDAGQDITGATPYFKERSESCAILFKCPDDQPVTCAKPKMPFFESSKLCKIAGFES